MSAAGASSAALIGSEGRRRAGLGVDAQAAWASPQRVTDGYIAIITHGCQQE